MEGAYEKALAFALRQAGAAVEEQKEVGIPFEGVIIDNAFRADLLVNRQLIVELKAVTEMPNLFLTQTQTYIRLLNLPLGLLSNFNVEHLRDGIKRIINPYWTQSR